MQKYAFFFCGRIKGNFWKMEKTQEVHQANRKVVNSPNVSSNTVYLKYAKTMHKKFLNNQWDK